MSQENLEVVRAASAAFERGDLTAFLEAMSDDVIIHRPDFGDIYHGKRGYLEVTSDWNEQFAEWSAVAEEFIVVSGHVVVRVHQTARGEKSGVPVEADYWFTYEVAEGKIARIDMCRTRAQAFDCAARCPR